MKDINQASLEIAKELSKTRDEKVKRIRQRINTGSYKVQSLRVAQAIVSSTPSNNDKK